MVRSSRGPRGQRSPGFERNLVFGLDGLAPVRARVQNVTHLPPYMGIMFGLGLLWIVTEVMHWNMEPTTAAT